jgi:hypothetical protein
MSDLTPTPAPHRPQPPGDPAFAEPARETRAPFPAASSANPPLVPFVGRTGARMAGDEQTY